jgi:hypothetical protein
MYACVYHPMSVHPAARAAGDLEQHLEQYRHELTGDFGIGERRRREHGSFFRVS